jgi:hypothetical protein
MKYIFSPKTPGVLLQLIDLSHIFKQLRAQVVYSNNPAGLKFNVVIKIYTDELLLFPCGEKISPMTQTAKAH